MLFAAVYPGVRDPGKFDSYIHYSPPILPCWIFSLFLEGFYNSVTLPQGKETIDLCGIGY
jgi:hypothetical protein